MTKSTKWVCTRRRLRSAWRIFTVRMEKIWVLCYISNAQRRLWTDWPDAQADLSLRWAHIHCWFCHVAAHMFHIVAKSVLEVYLILNWLLKVAFSYFKSFGPFDLLFIFISRVVRCERLNLARFVYLTQMHIIKFIFTCEKLKFDNCLQSPGLGLIFFTTSKIHSEKERHHLFVFNRFMFSPSLLPRPRSLAGKFDIWYM